MVDLVVRIRAEAGNTKRIVDEINAALGRLGGTATASISQASSGFGRLDKAARDSGDAFGSILGNIRSAASAAAAFFGLSVSANTARGILAQAEAYQTLTARLKLVADNSREFAQSQQLVFQIAQSTRQPLNQVAELYGKIETSLDGLGGSQQQAAQATEAIALAIQASGGSAESAAAAILQFTQGLQSGVLRGEEFNSIAEQAPALLKALADGLGEPVANLRQLAEAGQLTSDRVLPALISQLGNLRAQAGQLPTTLGQAFVQLNNRLEVFLGKLDQSLGITRSLAQTVQQFGANLVSPDSGLFKFTEGVVIATTAISEFVRAANGEKRPPLLDQIEASRKGFDDLRQSAGLSANAAREQLGGLDSLQSEFLGAGESAVQSAAKQAQAIADGQIKAQEALKVTKDRLNDITDVLNDQFQRNLGAVDQTQQIRQTNNQGSGGSETRQERANTQILLDATQERLRIIRDYSTQRLALIAQTIDSEKARTGAGLTTIKEIERASIEERKKLYTELEGAYKSTIDKLIAEQERQKAAAIQAQQDINSFNQQIADTLLSTRVQNADPQSGALLVQQRQQADLAALQEAAAGRLNLSQKEQNDLINRSIESSKQLLDIKRQEAEATASTPLSARAGQDAAQLEFEQSLNSIRQAGTKILENQKQTAQDNAKALGEQAQSVQAQLTTVQQKIVEIDQALAQQRELKIAIDENSLKTLRDTIAELTAPATKVVTIQTQDGSEGVPAKAFGGLIRGPGSSTSDSILAYLSDGEFVVRAAAVQRYGLGFFQRLNAMVLPGFAQGGLVDRLQMPSFTPSLGASTVPPGTPINLTLPSGQSFPLTATPDVAAGLARTIRMTRYKVGV